MVTNKELEIADMIYLVDFQCKPNTLKEINTISDHDNFDIELVHVFELESMEFIRNDSHLEEQIILKHRRVLEENWVDYIGDRDDN